MTIVQFWTNKKTMIMQTVITYIALLVSSLLLHAKENDRATIHETNSELNRTLANCDIVTITLIKND